MRFQITYRDGAYYVSIPNYDGGEVVDAASADALVKALEKIDTMIGNFERTLTLPDAAELKDIWYVAREAIAAYRKEP